MALIECSECKGQVSDKAEACPHCGTPVEGGVQAEFQAQGEEVGIVYTVSESTNPESREIPEKIEKICINCSFIGSKKDFTKYKGLAIVLLETALWLWVIVDFLRGEFPFFSFIFAAVAYSLLHTDTNKECPVCKSKSDNHIPADSPKGREILQSKNNNKN